MSIIIPDGGTIGSTSDTDAISISSSGAVTLSSDFVPATPLSNRNRMINGDMRIDQRNEGSAVTNNGTAETYPVDRFLGVGVSSDGVYTLQRVTDSPDDFNYSIKAIVTTADTSIPSSGRYIIRTKLEGYSLEGFNFGTSSAKTITLSFYAKSTIAGTYGGTFINGAQDRSYPFSYTISSTNTWERKSITITADTTGTWPIDNSKALQIGWSLGVGSTYEGTAGAWVGSHKWGVTGETKLIATNSATFQLTGVQLELGSVATPFEHRSYGDELDRCYRYFYKKPADGSGEDDLLLSSDYNNSTNNFWMTFFYPKEMRVKPAYGNGSGWEVASPGNINEGLRWVAFNFTNGAAYMSKSTTFTLDAEL